MSYPLIDQIHHPIQKIDIENNREILAGEIHQYRSQLSDAEGNGRVSRRPPDGASAALRTKQNFDAMINKFVLPR